MGVNGHPFDWIIAFGVTVPFFAWHLRHWRKLAIVQVSPLLFLWTILRQDHTERICKVFVGLWILEVFCACTVTTLVLFRVFYDPLVNNAASALVSLLCTTNDDDVVLLPMSIALTAYASLLALPWAFLALAYWRGYDSFGFRNVSSAMPHIGYVVFAFSIAALKWAQYTSDSTACFGHYRRRDVNAIYNYLFTLSWELWTKDFDVYALHGVLIGLIAWMFSAFQDGLGTCTTVPRTALATVMVVLIMLILVGNLSFHYYNSLCGVLLSILARLAWSHRSIRYRVKRRYRWCRRRRLQSSPHPQSPRSLPLLERRTPHSDDSMMSSTVMMSSIVT